MTDLKPRAADSMTSPTTNTVTDDAVERGARAIAADDGANWDARHSGETMSGNEPDDMRAGYRGMARACLTAALSTHPHTGGREAVIEECAAIFDIRAKAHKEAWNTCASDGHRNASHWRDRMYEALSAAASIRALSLSPPLQKTQKE